MSTHKVAPRGFTLEQWKQFQQDGIILIEDALSENDINEYLEAIDRVTQKDPNYIDGNYYGIEHIVERDPIFTGLIDHPRHIGFAYDIYGELLKLHQSQLFIRSPQKGHNNMWHPDGARAGQYCRDAG